MCFTPQAVPGLSVRGCDARPCPSGAFAQGLRTCSGGWAGVGHAKRRKSAAATSEGTQFRKTFAVRGLAEIEGLRNGDTCGIRGQARPRFSLRGGARRSELAAVRTQRRRGHGGLGVARREDAVGRTCPRSVSSASITVRSRRSGEYAGKLQVPRKFRGFRPRKPFATGAQTSWGLLGSLPLHEITPDDTPALATAAREALLRRGAVRCRCWVVSVAFRSRRTRSGASPVVLASLAAG